MSQAHPSQHGYIIVIDRICYDRIGIAGTGIQNHRALQAHTGLQPDILHGVMWQVISIAWLYGADSDAYLVPNGD